MIKIRTWEVLDNMIGPSFVFRHHLPNREVQIKFEDKPVIIDANFRSLNIVDTVTLFVRFWSYVVKVCFYVCDKLATVYVLGGEFFDKVFNYVKLRESIVELYDETKSPIIRKRPKRGEESVSIAEKLEDSHQEGRLPHMVRISRTFVLRPKLQTTVMVSSDRLGLMAIQPNENLYAKYNIF